MASKILAEEMYIKINGEVYEPIDDTFEITIDPPMGDKPKSYVVMINNIIPAMPDVALNEFAKLIVLEREKRGLE